jgi:hypothetical protein
MPVHNTAKHSILQQQKWIIRQSWARLSLSRSPREEGATCRAAQGAGGQSTHPYVHVLAVCRAVERVLAPLPVAEAIKAHCRAISRAGECTLPLEVVAHHVPALAAVDIAVEWAALIVLTTGKVTPAVAAVGKPAVSGAVEHRLSRVAIAHTVAAPSLAVFDAAAAGFPPAGVANLVPADNRAVSRAVCSRLVGLGALAISTAKGDSGGGCTAVSYAGLGGLPSLGVTEPEHGHHEPCE